MTFEEAVRMIQCAKREIDLTETGWGRIEIVVSGREIKFVNVIKSSGDSIYQTDHKEEKNEHC